MSENNGTADRPDKGKGHKVNNTLTHSQMYKLMQWIDCRRDYIRNEKLIARKVAEETEKALGFPVTVSNVYFACKNLDLKLPHEGRRKAVKNSERLSDLEKGFDERGLLIGDLQQKLSATNASLTRLGESHAALSDRVNKLHTLLGQLPGIVREHNNMLQDMERQLNVTLLRTAK